MVELIAEKYYLLGGGDTVLDGPFNTFMEAWEESVRHFPGIRVSRWNGEEWSR